MINTDKDWEFYGKEDPYFGVITWEKFKKENLTNDNLKEFFESGTTHVSNILSFIREHIDPNFRAGKALDFGCGVGRLVVPLSSNFDFVLGVDVSVSMLNEAKKNCVERSIQNVDFVESDDTLSKVTKFGKFDLVHSFVVFQHIPCSRGEKIFQNLVDILEEGGVGVLHVTYFRNESWLMKQLIFSYKNFPIIAKIKSFFIGKKYKPLMQMNEYNLNKVFCILQSKNCKNIYLKFTRHGNTDGVFIYFQKG